MAMPAANTDRRPALYGTLVTFLVLNNLVVAARLYAHYRTYYKARRSIFLEDVFFLLSGVCSHLKEDNIEVKFRSPS